MSKASKCGVLVAIGLLSISTGVGAWASAGIPIQRFMEVSPGIFRGARPDAAGLRALADLGIKTDLDLEDSAWAVSAEKRVVSKLGISMISIPLSGFWTPKNPTVLRILGILNDPAARPIFVHCHHGEDRTGLIVGLFRVFTDGWTPNAAYEEMRQMGFHPALIFLDRYFEDRTGYKD